MLFVSSVRDITQINWRTEYCSRLDVIDLPVRGHQYVVMAIAMVIRCRIMEQLLVHGVSVLE